MQRTTRRAAASFGLLAVALAPACSREPSTRPASSAASASAAPRTPPSSAPSGGARPGAPTAAPGPVPAPSRVTVALHEVGLREVLAAVAEVEGKPVFVEPGAGAVGACAELDVEGELVRGRSAAFVGPALAAHGLLLEDGAVALRVITAAGSPSPARDSRPPGRADCPLLPFVVSGAPPAPELAASLLDALVPEIGPPASAEAPPPGPARRVETRTLSVRGRELLRDHAALVLRTARVLVDATGGAAGAGALAAGTATTSPSAPAPAASTAAGPADARLALRVFFVEGFGDAGPLHALGLRNGDRVLSFAEGRDVSVASAEAALAALGSGSGTGARLLVERRGELVELRYDVK